MIIGFQMCSCHYRDLSHCIRYFTYNYVIFIINFPKIYILKIITSLLLFLNNKYTNDCWKYVVITHKHNILLSYEAQGTKII